MVQEIMWNKNRRYEVGDFARVLFDIVRDMQTGVIRIPTFQREFIWPMSKRQQFIGRLLEQRKPIGVIATYELENDSDHVVYLNDGLQRLSTLSEFLVESDLYGMPKDEAEELLRSYNFSVQHRRYLSHAEAAEDYKDINQGTPLTALEFYQADLTNMNDYETIWMHRLERLHELVKTQALTICARPQAERNIAHRYLRHDLSLFYRLAVNEIGVTSHGVNQRQASSVERTKKNYIEYRLQNWMTSSGPQVFDAKFRSLESIITLETALIESEFRLVQPERAKRLGVVMYRWILDAAIWRRNNSIRTETWNTFLKQLMQFTKGEQSFPGTAKKNAVIVMGDLTRLKYICKTIGSSMYEGDEPKRIRRSQNIQPGYDISHIKPFSLYGEGETILEPSSLNRARGASAVQFDES